jgi:hypothetical protein
LSEFAESFLHHKNHINFQQFFYVGGSGQIANGEIPGGHIYGGQRGTLFRRGKTSWFQV